LGTLERRLTARGHAAGMTDAAPLTHDDGLRAFQRRIADTPLLSAAEELELARRIAEGDADARRRLVEANLRLVVHLARPLHHPDGSLSLMELVQEGSLGLLRAAERFDHRRGLRFSTYAAWWIREALYRALDERGRLVRLPAAVRGEVKRLRAAERELEAVLGRTPPAGELAGALGAEPAAVAELRAAALTPASLDAAAFDEDDGGALVDRLVDDRLPDPGAELARAEREERVERLLAALKPLERRVLERRYGLGGAGVRSARDTARELGTTTAARLRIVEDLALRRLRALPGSEALAA